MVLASRRQTRGRPGCRNRDAWRSAPVSGRLVRVDLREVIWIDEAGRCLLQAMNQTGACFIAKGVAMEALVEEMTRKPTRRKRQA